MKHHQRQIIKVLADSVRAMTLEQISEHWWTNTRWGRSRAKASMRELASNGWINLQNALVRKIHRPRCPLLVWKPGDVQPVFEQTARVLQRRAKFDAKFVTVAYASRRAVVFFGNGPAPSIKLTQLTHDLNVSEVYLHIFRGRESELRWLSEDRLPRSWPIRERPDAVLIDATGKVVRAIEYGGDYPASRLEQLHVSLAKAEIGYELW